MSKTLRKPSDSVLHRLVGAAAGVLTAGAAVLLIPTAATAHDPVIGQAPEAGSTVTESLTEVSVTFSQPPLDVDGARIGLEVFDPSGAAVGTGEVRLDGATLSRSIATTVEGIYTVQYQSVSVDGHNNPGEYTFTYVGPVAVAENPVAGTSTPIPGGPMTAQPDATTAPTMSPAPTTDAEQTNSAEESPAVQTGLVVGAIIGALVVIGAIIAIVVGVRRRQSSLPPSDGSARG